MTQAEDLPPPRPISSAVKWRGYPDGIVVFVCSTCETHHLMPELMPVFMSGSAVRVPASRPTSELIVMTDSGTVLLEAPFFDKLADLKIIQSPN